VGVPGKCHEDVGERQKTGCAEQDRTGDGSLRVSCYEGLLMPGGQFQPIRLRREVM
jgi:hypothetical protein